MFRHLDPVAAVLPLALLLLALVGCPLPDAGLPDSPDAGGDGGSNEGGDGGTGDGGVVPTSGWNPLTQLGPDLDGSHTEIRTVDVALGAEGTRALVAWDEITDTRGSIWMRAFDGSAWLPRVRISPETQEAGGPRLALNDAGEAAVAYVVDEVNGAGESLGDGIWFSRSSSGVWSDPERLSPTPPEDPNTLFSAYDPSLGIDGEGRAFVAWTQYVSEGGEQRGVFMRRHDGSGWSEPMRLNEGTLPADLEGLVVSRSGRAAVVWVQDTNPYDPGKPGGGPRMQNVWARTHDGSSWTAPVRIGPDLLEFEFIERPVLTMNANGEVFVVWEERRLEQARLGAARFDPVANAWDTPVTVASSAAVTEHLAFLSVAADEQGNAMVTWEATLPDTDEEAGVASRFDAATGSWSEPSTFVTLWSVDGIRAAMGADGRGWALYSRPNDSGTMQILARELATDGSWSEPALVGGGWIEDAEGNGDGVVLLGARKRWYASSQPLMREAPAAALRLP